MQQPVLLSVVQQPVTQQLVTQPSGQLNTHLVDILVVDMYLVGSH